MSKVKTPLLSLRASGTIANSLTFQRKNKVNFVRGKPIPAYRRTLPQVYQRWLYEDYAYLWTQQTPTTKASFAAQGSRFHLTGFQYWMKYNLKNLPDIIGWWHLDEKAGTIAKDFSRNAFNGTIYGALPTAGVINGAFSFDGNDYIAFGTNPLLRPDTFTFECFAKITLTGRDGPLFIFRDYFSPGIGVEMSSRPIIILGGYNYRYFSATNPVNIYDGTYHHLLFIITGNGQNDILNSKMYADGKPQAIYSTENSGLPRTKLACFLGGKSFPCLLGSVDEARLYNRILDTTEILRHSLRRYPA